MQWQAVRVTAVIIGIVVCNTMGSAQTRAEPCVDPTAIFTVEQPFRPVVHDLWRRAPTFRRQLLRLASQPSPTIAIRPWLASRGEFGARTIFARVEGRLARAEVEIKILGALAMAELIGHELEHVLEQVDGVDLMRMRGRADVMVSSRLDREVHIETKRAQRVGRIVAAEYSADALRTASDVCSGGRP